MSVAFLLFGQRTSWSVASVGGWALCETMHDDVLVQGSWQKRLLAGTHLVELFKNEIKLARIFIQTII